ncbi:MAG: hypothetical protein JJE39_15335 [Vicinamibacteria bacterium]|nr:hypothetical protein [Vicinamibacteria bacterium]
MTLLNRRSRFLLSLGVLCLAASAWSQTAPPAPASASASSGLPLPQALVRLAIPDVPAFDAALGGGFKKALYGTLPEGDGVALGFGQSQVGAKLQDQWSRFHGETALSFQTLVDLQTTSLALAILNVGHLEMVLVLETPLAELPDIFEEGVSRIDHGRTYHLVRTGAADEGADGETRMGLVWSRDSGRLMVATSERAMKLALAAVEAGARFTPRLDGLASLELDTEALQQDLYFKREFLFDSLPTASESRGKISAALRMEGGRLVEVREGALAAAGHRGATFEAKDAVASGWIGDSSQLLAELRRGVLEPIPEPSLRPQLAIVPLPGSKAASAEDRYATSIEVALPVGGGAASEGAEIEAWKALLSAQPIEGFGYAVTKSRARLLAIPWPKGKDSDLASLLDATLTRRGARLASSSPTSTGEARQYLMGPSLPVLALKRSGDFIWIAPSADDLRAAPAISWSKDTLRFSKIDLNAAREEGKRWAGIEGPASPDRVRPFSDRVLGLVGWMPAVRTIEVDRRVTPAGFQERVVFGVTPRAASPAAK